MTPMQVYVGRRVRIKNCDRYGGEVNGHCGIIRSCYSPSSIAVRMDDMINKGSRYGYFHFDSSMLEFVGPNDSKTNEGSTDTMKIEKYLNVAVVRFLDNDPECSPVYEYANFDSTLREGDVCAVMSAHHGMGLARVVRIKPGSDVALTREIVAKIDTMLYDERVAQRKKAAELKEKMQARAKQLQDISLYKILAADDPEMKQLLDEYLGVTDV